MNDHFGSKIVKMFTFQGGYPVVQEGDGVKRGIIELVPRFDVLDSPKPFLLRLGITLQYCFCV